MKFEWHNIFTPDMLIVVFTFLFVNLFDTIGTLLGVASKIGLTDNEGSFPQIKRALLPMLLAQPLVLFWEQVQLPHTLRVLLA